MRILLVHNFYQQAGGEDAVFESEGGMLESYGHDVLRYSVDNDAIKGLGAVSAAVKAIWNRQTYREIRTLIQSYKPDVAHFHNTFPLISPAAYYAARAEGVAVVQTLHNYRLLCPAATMFRDGVVCEDCRGKIIPYPGVLNGCYRGSRAASAAVATMLTVHRATRTWKRAVDRYIALTEFTRRMFIESGFPPEKIMTKPNFVFPDPGMGDGKGKHAIFVGRLYAGKGLPSLLEAWKQIGNKVPLKIIGDGPLAEEVTKRAREIPGVEWLGKRPADETRRLMGDAKVLIFPSKWYETFGLVAIEAFARGTPVIASRLAGMAEIIDDGRNGRLFKEGDVEDLASKVLETCIGNDAALQRMRLQARRDYEEKYTAEANHRRSIEIYEEAIHAHGGHTLRQRESNELERAALDAGV